MISKKILASKNKMTYLNKPTETRIQLAFLLFEI